MSKPSFVLFRLSLSWLFGVVVPMCSEPASSNPKRKAGWHHFRTRRFPCFISKVGLEAVMLGVCTWGRVARLWAPNWVRRCPSSIESGTISGRGKGFGRCYWCQLLGRPFSRSLRGIRGLAPTHAQCPNCRARPRAVNLAVEPQQRCKYRGVRVVLATTSPALLVTASGRKPLACGSQS